MSQRLSCILILTGLGLFPALARAQNAPPRQAPNWYLDLSREFFETALAQHTESVDPVHDVILGTRIRGTGRTFARTGVQFIPSDGDATIDLVTHGTTYTNTVGVNGKINLVPQWYISAHGGYFRANDNNQNYNNSVGQDLGFSSGGRADRGSWYAGLGTGWDVNEHFGIGVSYDYFHADAGKVRNNATGEVSRGLKRSTGIVSLAGEYRF